MKCTDKHMGRLILLYEFDKLTHHQKKSFEAHLLECNHCFQNLYKLSPIMEQMRENPQAFLPALTVPRRIPFREKLRTFWDKLVPDMRGVPVTVFKPVRIAVAVVVAIIIAVLVTVPSPKDCSDLARIEPIRYISVEIRGDQTMTEADKLFDEGMQLYGLGKYNQAIIKLSQTISKMDNNKQAQFYLGLCYLLSNEVDSAIVHFREVADHGNKALSEKCHWYLGNAYLLKNEWALALQEFEAVLNFEGDYWFEAQEMIKEIQQMKNRR